jgi:thioredoxin reductase (NADPH)
MSRHDLIIAGAGVTGLAAALQARADGLSVALLESTIFGGLVVNVNELDGEPGGSGAELAARMARDAARAGVVHVSAAVAGVEPAEGGLLRVASDDAPRLARAVLAATGARLRRLGVPGEAELADRGVSGCADCDGPLYAGRTVVVVGGGDAAMQEARVLAEHCAEVVVLLRGERPRARGELVDALAACANVRLRPRTTVEAILGADEVTGVRLRGPDGASAELACAAVFAYVGLEPASGWLPKAVERDALGAARTDASFATAVPGLYAAGAVRAGYRGRLADAIAEGRAAARAIAARLATG